MTAVANKIAHCFLYSSFLHLPTPAINTAAPKHITVLYLNINIVSKAELVNISLAVFCIFYSLKRLLFMFILFWAITAFTIIDARLFYCQVFCMQQCNKIVSNLVRGRCWDINSKSYAEILFLAHLRWNTATWQWIWTHLLRLCVRATSHTFPTSWYNSYLSVATPCRSIRRSFKLAHGGSRSNIKAVRQIRTEPPMINGDKRFPHSWVSKCNSYQPRYLHHCITAFLAFLPIFFYCTRLQRPIPQKLRGIPSWFPYGSLHQFRLVLPYAFCKSLSQLSLFSKQRNKLPFMRPAWQFISLSHVNSFGLFFLGGYAKRLATSVLRHHCDRISASRHSSMERKTEPPVVRSAWKKLFTCFSLFITFRFLNSKRYTSTHVLNYESSSHLLLFTIAADSLLLGQFSFFWFKLHTNWQEYFWYLSAFNMNTIQNNPNYFSLYCMF